MALKLSDLTSAAAVQSALDEFAALGQQAFLVRHGFRKASGYVVVNPRTGDWADSKAIAGVALGYQFPGSSGLKAGAFSGGSETVQRRLQGLGFEVRKLDDIAGTDWSADEVALVVADYLSMLALELNGQSFNKTAHRRYLLSLLPHRTEGAIEFKHCNISAVMLELGYPYVKGYLPRANFQRSLLVDEVALQVVKRNDLDLAALQAVERPAVAPSLADFSKLKTAPPAFDGKAQDRHAISAERSPIKRDYFAREALNRSLGKAGETFALSYERWRLLQLGAGQLAEAVKHVSVDEGDGLGYDIRSFEADGELRLIEVKTTSFGERTPFYVTANELQVSKREAPRYRVYRLFDFRTSPRMFELAGAVDQHCALDPATYRASFA